MTPLPEFFQPYSANYRIFVETGTGNGATTEAVSGWFDRLYTIEGNADYYRMAQDRIGSIEKITSYHGLSQDLLKGVLSEVDQPALIFLDAHWAWSPGYHSPDGVDCPVLQELEIIWDDGRRHLIVIDDARCFREGDGWTEDEGRQYPALSEIRALAEAHSYSYEVIGDEIVLSPV